MRMYWLGTVLASGLMIFSLGCGGGGSSSGGSGQVPNAAPTWTSAAPTSAKEGHPYSYVMAGQDSNADPLTITLVAGPAGASVAGTTLTWIPTAAQTGSPQAFKARLSDGKGGSADQDWAVTPVANMAPGFSTTPPATAKEGHAYAYTAAASDADGDAVSLSAVSLPAGATYNAGSIAWIPTAAQAGVAQTFTLRATDGFGGQKDQTWTVAPTANAAPVFTSAVRAVGAVGTLYTYTPTATDADGDAVSMSLITAPAGASLALGAIQWMPLASQAATPQTFLLRASDGYGKTADQSWTIYLRASNAAPVITSVPPTGGYYSYVYTITASDPDGDALTYSLDTAPAGASLVGPATAGFNWYVNWTPAPTQRRNPNAFTLRVTDALGASTAQSWSVIPSETITGTRILNALTDAGDVPRPDNISSWAPGTLAAICPDGAGGFTTLQGSGLADGTFTIPGVSSKYYWFKSGTNYFWTDTSTMDLGYDQGGRADAVAASSASTTLAFTMTGMNPWQSTDDLQWTVSNTGDSNSLLGYLGNPPAIGAAGLSNMSASWQFSHLNDATKGDQPYLTQLTTRTTAGGENYQALAKVFKPVPFSQVDGGSYTVTGGFSDVPQDQTIRLNIARSQFNQFQLQVHPAAVVYGGACAVDAQPGGLSRGWLQNTPDLFTWFPAAGTTDVDLGDLSYGNPFPGTWGRFIVVNHIFEVSYLLPGATTPTSLFPSIYVVTDQFPSATSPLRPLVSPVLSPKVNGLDFQVNHSGVGLTPVLSWTAPAMGLPTWYAISVVRLYNNGAGATVRSIPGRLYSKTNSVTVPPGILVAGSTYCFMISAYFVPGVDFATGPYRKRVPVGVSQAVSGMMTP